MLSSQEPFPTSQVPPWAARHLFIGTARHTLCTSPESHFPDEHCNLQGRVGAPPPETPGPELEHAWFPFF